MKEKVFIGNVANFALKDAINDELKSFRRSLNELNNRFIELSDLKDILENGGKTTMERFEAHLWQLNADIKNYPDRERNKQSIPISIEYFNKQVKNVKQTYDAIPSFLDKEKLLSYEFDDFERISCKWDYQLLYQSIDEQCMLYAETDKEIELFELIKELVDLANKIKKVAGVEVKATDLISDKCDREAVYNVDLINNLFKRIKNL